MTTSPSQCSQKVIWNGEESQRKMESDASIWDGSLDQCKFLFFCKTCSHDVIMEKASMYENDDGVIRTKCKCPICHKWSWLPQ